VSNNSDKDAADTFPSVSETPVRSRHGFVRRYWGRLLLAAAVVLPVGLFAAWSMLSLSFAYSSGERVGYVQKLSRKGWICKTWEGELQMSNIPGSAPILFAFSVRSDSLARTIQALAGTPVALGYEQHLGVPSSCFGETEYFIVSVRTVSARPVP
jgi:hypothetical protein